MKNIYDIWFSNIDVSNSVKLRLIEYFKESKKIWEADKKLLLEYGFKEMSINKILDNNYKVGLEKYANFIEKNNIDLLLCYSNKYPEKLKCIENRPAFLYVRGKLENLYGDSVAIVGSRESSNYGNNVAKKISKELADRNINIISGLAIGIDKYAHLGALESKIGKTIAVLGTDVLENNFYPKENKRIFEKILENNGTIVSEFKLGTKAEKYNFPRRNRIISGLSEKIIVVEAKEKSGSLITVDYGLEQGKDIFAVPGNINSSNSKGTNKMILEGAKIFTNVEDIFFLEN